MRDDSDLDRTIDTALASYADADSGLEQRVLARIAAESSRVPRLRRMAWALALATAAGLLLFILLERPKPKRELEQNAEKTPQAQHAPRATARVEPQGALRIGGPSHRSHSNRAVVKPAVVRLPKQDVFPAPQPLSPAERALVEFAAQAPEAERQSFVAAQEQLDKPIEVSAIHIDPIQIPPLEPPQPGAD